MSKHTEHGAMSGGYHSCPLTAGAGLDRCARFGLMAMAAGASLIYSMSEFLFSAPGGFNKRYGSINIYIFTLPAAGAATGAASEKLIKDTTKIA